MWHARGGGFDVLHVHAIGPGLLLPLARLLGFRHTVLTFHALDYERAKWGAVAKAMLRLSERVAVRYASEVIAVSRSGTDHLERTYRRRVHYIPNGPGEMTRREPGELLARLGLKGGDYVLFVGRLIPEKCPDDLAAAVAGLPDLKVVFAGDSSYTDEFTQRLRATAGRPGGLPRLHARDGSRGALLVGPRLRAAVGGRGPQHQPAGGDGVRAPHRGQRHPRQHRGARATRRPGSSTR